MSRPASIRLSRRVGGIRSPTRRIIGRGPDLHLLIDHNWYRLNFGFAPAWQQVSGRA